MDPQRPQLALERKAITNNAHPEDTEWALLYFRFLKQPEELTDRQTLGL